MNLDRRVAALERSTPAVLQRPQGTNLMEFIALHPDLAVEDVPAFCAALTHQELREFIVMLENDPETNGDDRKDSKRDND
jgi:hypothetical protein